MNLIKEFINPEAVQLTSIQKGVLATIATAATPEIAYETCNGVQSLVIARNILRTLGLVRISQGQLALTDQGQEALITNNILDDTGQLTEDGESYIAMIDEERSQELQKESYQLLNGFLT